MDRGEAGNTAASPDNAPRPPRVPLPASVKINVEGAFIVDDEAVGNSGTGNDGIHYERKDIRLPYHTAVVSHVAVDVRSLFYSIFDDAWDSELTMHRLEDRLPNWFTFRGNQDQLWVGADLASSISRPIE